MFAMGNKNLRKEKTTRTNQEKRRLAYCECANLTQEEETQKGSHSDPAVTRSEAKVDAPALCALDSAAK